MSDDAKEFFGGAALVVLGLTLLFSLITTAFTVGDFYQTQNKKDIVEKRAETQMEIIEKCDKDPLCIAASNVSELGERQ